MVQFRCEYLFLAKRLSAFENESRPHGSHYAAALADHSFFYLGCGDCVQCCYCDVGLTEWDPKSDLPQVEHDRESPHCALKFKDRVASKFKPGQSGCCTPRSFFIRDNYEEKINKEQVFLAELKKRDVQVPERIREVE